MHTCMISIMMAHSVSLLVIVFFLPPIVDCECNSASSPTDRRTQTLSVTFGTFNAEWLFDGVGDQSYARWHNQPISAAEHVQNIADVINALDVDILGLIETEDCTILANLTSRLPKHKGYLRQGGDHATGQDVSLVTRIDPTVALERTDSRVNYPIATSTCGYTGSASSTGTTKHFYTDFTFGNTTVRVIVLHFIAFPTNRDRCAKREAQAMVMVPLIQQALDAGSEVVVMGDFNDFDESVADIDDNEPRSTVLDILKDPNRDGTDELYNVMNLLPKSERFTAFYDSNRNDRDDGARDRSAIDHILLTKRLYDNITSVKARHELFEADTVSDHWPLMVTVQLEGDSSGGSQAHSLWSTVFVVACATALLYSLG
eukprot:TRINITY_DN110_c0_g1_i1.p1 TRINITY_DN110_c0_g1~~TRINITY_DN110_c0_g1_i1.p1  ORF type:complete len:373 (+),score=66.24 TRINITY_DN110_c0_g1_i1:3-1121(+)